MSSDVFIFPVLALALGLKHAYDADHLVAVSNFLTKSKGMRETSRMTISWAIGHMLTAAIITVLIFTLVTGTRTLTDLLSYFEPAVAIMLIAIGLVGIFWEVPVAHEHPHRHGTEVAHSHLHRHRLGGGRGLAARAHLHHPLLGVGIIHGLASNDELLVLFVAGLGAGSLELLLGGVAVFTVGVAAGMLIFGIAVTYPLFRFGRTRVQRLINIVAGLLSVAYGLLILAGLGGFNPFNFFPS